MMGGVTGGVRLPLVWRGGVAVLFLDTPPVMDRDSLGVAFFFMVSCSRRAASVMNLMAQIGRVVISEFHCYAGESGQSGIREPQHEIKSNAGMV